ncbi:FRIGIDA-like protein 3 [Impatiens glandulifera]|uniref:FRIGIDA-like protein 3 n=1 Tax=Impatiens glandulifera TaxID=253017 RepID=UPI001FB10DDF|nr:FRIGIDA-like protein 3 [Impatiens glandulifera]
MEDTQSVSTLIDSTTSKIQQLQKAFAELESHRAVTLNLKWKQLEEHFHGLEKSLKRRFTELEDQEKEFENRTGEAQVMLEKREAAVVAKEQASLERLQEKRDAAYSIIANAIQKRRNVVDADGDEDQGGELVTDEQPLENHLENTKSSFVNVNMGVKSHPELVKLCQEMDSEGLHKFISDNRKNLSAMKEDIPFALRAASDPASLVLNSLNGFYCTDSSSADGKKDGNLLGIRRTCIMLMECLSILLTSLNPSSVSNLISEDIKERAKGIAKEWKPKLADLDMDANNGSALEAHAFLQLLATFGINSDFDQEDLIKLVPMVSRRRQTADLCRSLGLSEKMPGVINVLVQSGRHIDAVNLAFAFELTSQFSPVSLLKSYLNEAKKATSPVKAGNTSHVQNDINEKELMALKGVIKCIEEHKMEQQYPLDPLNKRVVQLEKAKEDKKRGTEVVKPQTKRPRASGNGIGIGHGPPRMMTNNNMADKNNNFHHPRMVTDNNNNNRYQQQQQQQYMYERPYFYHGPPPPAENHVTMTAQPAYGLPAGHGNFFGNGFQYQAAYLH